MGFPGSQSRTLKQWPQARRWIFILLWLVIGVVRPAQAQGIVYEYSAITEVSERFEVEGTCGLNPANCDAAEAWFETGVWFELVRVLIIIGIWEIIRRRAFSGREPSRRTAESQNLWLCLGVMRPAGRSAS